MSADHFQFKQFRVAQDKCAMKVSTDACIQGAWTPLPDPCLRVCDIGTGTGLLSLMLAQRNPQAHFDAIELDPLAAEQAAENVAAAPFKNAIQVINADVTQYEPTAPYDLIVCNPPFFAADLKSPNVTRNLARHEATLSTDSLVDFIKQNLCNAGLASILLPADRENEWLSVAGEAGLYCSRRLYIFPFAQRKHNRVVFLMQCREAEPVTEQLIIYAQERIYTEAFKALLRPFYLYL